jgi:hypothetical protein
LSTIDASLLRAAAAAAAGHQSHPGATLYLVATPIGNRADITLRALHVLGRADAVACEDTRVTAQLLAHYGLDKPLLAVHAHNENEAAARVCERLAAGRRWPSSAMPARPACRTRARGWWRRRWRPGTAWCRSRGRAAPGGHQRGRRRGGAGLCLPRLPAGQGRRAPGGAAGGGGRCRGAGAVRGAAPHRVAGGGLAAAAPARR